MSPIFFQVRSFPPAYCLKLQFSSELPRTLKSFYMAYLHFFFQSNALKSFNLSTQIRSIKVIYRSLFYGKKWLLECLRSKVIMKLILEKNCQTIHQYLATLFPISTSLFLIVIVGITKGRLQIRCKNQVRCSVIVGLEFIR